MDFNRAHFYEASRIIDHLLYFLYQQFVRHDNIVVQADGFEWDTI